MALSDVLEEFGGNTTLHGVPRIISAKTTTLKFLWSFICIAAGAMFCMQMSVVCNRYFSYPKKVTVGIDTAAMPFPSISICNMRNLDADILNTLNRKFLENQHPSSHINSSHPFIGAYMKLVAKYGPLWYDYGEMPEYQQMFQSLFSRTTFSSNIPQEIVQMASVQMEEFIVNCYFSGTDCDKKNDFTRFFDPYYFNCFTYDHPHNNLKAPLSEGIENGWSAILFSGSGILDKNEDIRVLPGLHESKSAVAASEGVRVVIHPEGTQPFPFTEGYDVPPGFSASFGIRPRKTFRIGQPHGNCSWSNALIAKLENKTDKEEGYRMLSCQKMCLQYYVVKDCGCSDISLPALPNSEVKPCRTIDDFPDHCMFRAGDDCLESFLRFNERNVCARTTRDRVVKDIALMGECQCHPPCDEISYDVFYSLSKWPATGYEGDAAYMDIFYVEYFRERFPANTSKHDMVMRYFVDSKRNETMKDFTRLNVYIADSNVIITTESEDYTATQLVSDLGGQLGLWVGISVITLAEVLELVFDLCRLFFSARRRDSPGRRQKNIHDMDSKMANNHKPQYSSAFMTDPQQTENLIVMSGLNGDSSRFEYSDNNR